MKAILKQIDKLTDQIESGIYTKHQALLKIRDIKGLISDKYDVDSDNYTECLWALIDTNELAQNL